jgi:hypothetical protein
LTVTLGSDGTTGTVKVSRSPIRHWSMLAARSRNTARTPGYLPHGERNVGFDVLESRR